METEEWGNHVGPVRGRPEGIKAEPRQIGAPVGSTKADTLGVLRAPGRVFSASLPGVLGFLITPDTGRTRLYHTPDTRPLSAFLVQAN